MKLRSGKMYSEEDLVEPVDFEFDYNYDDIYLDEDIFNLLYQEGRNKNLYILRKARLDRKSYEQTRLDVISKIIKMLQNSFNKKYSEKSRMEFLTNGLMELVNFWDKRTMTNQVFMDYMRRFLFEIKNSNAVLWSGYCDAKQAIILFARRLITEY